MINLLKIEWLKIKGYRTFWVLATLFLVSIFGINYFVYYIKQVTVQNNKQVNAIVGAPFDFPNVWDTVSYFSGFLLFIPGLMIITSVTNEYSFKTNRQNIIDGWSRLQFITVKIALVVILSLISAIFVFLTALLFGTISGSSFSFLKIEYVGYYFIQAVSYSMVALLFSLFIKRSGLAIGVFFLYSLIIENMIGALINYYSHGGIKVNGPGDYLPLNSTDYLIPFPFFRNVIQFSTQPSIYLLLGLSATYLALYYFLSLRKFQRDDL